MTKHIGRIGKMAGVAAVTLGLGLALGALAPAPAFAEGRWMSGEYHTHTCQSPDATSSYMGLQNNLAVAFRDQPVMDALQSSEPNTLVSAIRDNDPYDFLLFAEHMRHCSAVTTHGNGDNYTTPYYQAVQAQQEAMRPLMDTRYQGKIAFSGCEWDAPGMDHVTVGLLAPGSNEVPYEGWHEFEWKYGPYATDDPTSMYPNGGAEEQAKWGDRMGDNNIQHTYDAVKWISDNYSDSYVMLNHISARWVLAPKSYVLQNIRVMHDIAPRNVFGFEALPGDEMSGSRRGEIPYSYYGADPAVAKTGGLWDSLLAEGRRIYAFTNADYHFKVSSDGRYSSGYWPSEYARNRTYVEDKAQDGYDVHDVVDGMRSGNSYCAFGNIIDYLDFSAQSAGKSATMGQDLNTTKGDPVSISIRVRVPEVNNYETIRGTDTGMAPTNKPNLDHIDLIRGSVTGKLDPAQYSNSDNTDAKIIKTFSKEDLGEPDEQGFYTLTFEDTPEANCYYRIRGLSGSDVDANGDPTEDAQYDHVADNDVRFDKINDQNYTRYSFYANPIFVNVMSANPELDAAVDAAEKALGQFDSVGSSAYSADSYKVYAEAAEALRALLGRTDATVDEVTRATASLEDAYAGLVVVKPGTSTSPNVTGQSKPERPQSERPQQQNRPQESERPANEAKLQQIQVEPNKSRGDELAQTGDPALFAVGLSSGAAIISGIGAYLARRRK